MQEHKTPCFIAATANDVQKLPPEFLRKGRFDEIFFVDLPNLEVRKHLVKIHLEKRKLNLKLFDSQKIAKITEGFSRAEIEQAIISALYRSSSQEKPTSTDHIIEQIESTRPLSVVKREQILALKAWAKKRTISA